MRKQALVLAFGLAVVGAAAPLHAQTGALCSLPANSYGGSGISTDNSYCAVGGTVDGILVALSATPRYSSPAVTTDGAGTYFAGTGNSTGAPVDAGFSAWNFDYFTGGVVAGGPVAFFRLTVVGDASTGFTTPMTFDWTGNNHDSTNGGYLPGFDPFAPGVYSFDLAEYSNADRTRLVQQVAIKVDVTGTPEPASLALMSTGLLGLGGFVRRRKQLAK
ncbi:MAG: PEP-CTERM sorting domain-containing protein [Gemmatimonadaceae bacterium]